MMEPLNISTRIKAAPVDCFLPFSVVKLKSWRILANGELMTMQNPQKVN